VGFAHRFRPTYAGANVGHPCGVVGHAEGLRGGPAVSHISRKTSEMWGTRRSVAGIEPTCAFSISFGLMAGIERKGALL
jgi:hypothetical protein